MVEFSKRKWIEKVIMYIIGNKYDLIEREAVNEEEARAYAESQNVPLCLTSAKDSTGINDYLKKLD